MQFTKMAQIQISDSVAVTYLGYTSLLSSIGQQSSSCLSGFCRRNSCCKKRICEGSRRYTLLCKWKILKGETIHRGIYILL